MLRYLNVLQISIGNLRLPTELQGQYQLFWRRTRLRLKVEFPGTLALMSLSVFVVPKLITDVTPISDLL